MSREVVPLLVAVALLGALALIAAVRGRPDVPADPGTPPAVTLIGTPP